MAWPANGTTDWNTAMKAFIDVAHDTNGYIKKDVIKCDVNGTETIIKTKYLYGTLAATDPANIAHGIADFEKILSVNATVYDDTTSGYILTEAGTGAVSNGDLEIYYNATNVVFSCGTNYRGNKYRIKIEYIA